MTASRAASDVSTHYLGERGRYYAEWQAEEGLLRGELNAFKFARYLARDDRVLDFGCSDGALLAALPARRKYGVEPNVHVRRRAAERGIDVRASLADVGDSEVDVAISNHVLEHVLNPYGALVALHRVLRPGGRLVLCVPAEDWRKARRWRPGDRNHHLYTWTPLTLGNLLAEAGFAVERVELLTHAWPPRYGQLFRTLPRPVFDVVCAAWSAARRQRQLLAVARR